MVSFKYPEREVIKKPPSYECIEKSITNVRTI